jgi:hypothetical protein
MVRPPVLALPDLTTARPNCDTVLWSSLELLLLCLSASVSLEGLVLVLPAAAAGVVVLSAPASTEAPFMLKQDSLLLLGLSTGLLPPPLLLLLLRWLLLLLLLLLRLLALSGHVD